MPTTREVLNWIRRSITSPRFAEGLPSVGMDRAVLQFRADGAAIHIVNRLTPDVGCIVALRDTGRLVVLGLGAAIPAVELRAGVVLR
jgi:hypothetical protein